MPVRNRSRTRRSVSRGQFVLERISDGAIAGGINYSTSGPSWTETCSDTTMPRPYVTDHPLVIIDKRADGFRMNGIVPYSGTHQWRVTDYYFDSRMLAAFCPPVTASADAYWVTKALANMNPSKPLVDLPLFVFELKDFPHMLKEAGDLLARVTKLDSRGRALGVRGLSARDVPKAHLSIAFGWKPLISDLLDLANLARSIEGRKAYLKALENGTHVKRTLFKGELSRSNVPNGLTWSLGATPVFRADVLTTEYQKVWFTANAKLLAPLPDADPTAETNYVNALGLAPRAETLWNAFPWSWLIDYFLNVGDVLGAYGGYIPWKATRMNLMRMNIAKTTLNGVWTHSGLKVTGGGDMTTTSKRRAVTLYPYPMLSMVPFLSGSQMAILGSLATLSALREVNIAR